ncbi:MAG: hypothetical protein IJ449_11995 [Clostridia bacterium]|nr:hypothetical protein [Clostridia bacterium]
MKNATQNRTQATASLLLLLLLTAVSVSCGNGGETGTPTSTDTSPLSNTATANTEEHINWESSGLPQVDYDGRAFNILSADIPDRSHSWKLVDTEETNGDELNDAIFTRNAKIEELYNISIGVEYTTDNVSKFRQLILSGDDSYSVYYNFINKLFTLSLEGVFCNFHDMPYINMEADWWDQQMIADLTVDDSLYILTGDINPHLNTKSFVIIFNKDMCDALDLEMPYETVLEGNWTLDVLKQYVSDINSDLNGDGKMDWNDRWGFLSEKANSYIMYFSGGGRVTQQNADGKWEISFDSDKNVTLAQKSLEITADVTTTLLADDYAAQNSWSAVSSWYSAGGALMRSTALEPIPRDYRSLDVNFGVLPYPKMDDTQASYVTLVGEGYVFAVPITADEEFTGLILEALAVESVETVTPAFYDRCLNGKALRDEESEDMLDIIFASKTFDIGLTNNDIGFLNTMSNLAVKGDTNAASAFASILSKAETAIEDMYDSFAAIE